VHGIIRRASSFNTARIDQLYQDPHEPDRRLFLHYGDLGDRTELRRVREKVRPGEVYPRNPDAVSQLAVRWMAVNYRDADYLFVRNGMLFNHESPRRGEPFVSPKITPAPGGIKLGLQSERFFSGLRERVRHRSTRRAGVSLRSRGSRLWQRGTRGGSLPTSARRGRSSTRARTISYQSGLPGPRGPPNISPCSLPKSQVRSSFVMS
jgi:GDP-mannose 4,6 dehydratase